MERLSPWTDFSHLEWPAIREEELRRARVATATPAPNRRAGSAMGPWAAKFGHLGWPACINIAKCLQLVRTAESFAAPAPIMGSNFVGANSDSSADPFAMLDLPSAPNRICEWRFPRERDSCSPRFGRSPSNPVNLVSSRASRRRSSSPFSLRSFAVTFCFRASLLPETPD